MVRTARDRVHAPTVFARPRAHRSGPGSVPHLVIRKGWSDSMKNSDTEPVVVDTEHPTQSPDGSGDTPCAY